MGEAIEQPGEAALPRPMAIGEILSTAFQLYRRHWRTLLAIRGWAARATWPPTRRCGIEVCGQGPVNGSRR
jgi:hypothetical protein